MSQTTNLFLKMNKYADEHKLPENHEIRLQATKFKEELEKYFDGKSNVKKFVGTWARTRKLWCQYSGEQLI